MSSEESQAAPGLGRLISLFSSHTLEHLRLLFQLVGTEGKEAGIHYVKVLVWLIVALTLLLFTYLLFILGAVFAIAHLAGVNWIWIAFGAAFLHLIGVAVCLLIIKGKLNEPMMKHSIAELKKDSEWLGSAPPHAPRTPVMEPAPSAKEPSNPPTPVTPPSATTPDPDNSYDSKS